MDRAAYLRVIDQITGDTQYNARITVFFLEAVPRAAYADYDPALSMEDKQFISDRVMIRAALLIQANPEQFGGAQGCNEDCANCPHYDSESDLCDKCYGGAK